MISKTLIASVLGSCAGGLSGIVVLAGFRAYLDPAVFLALVDGGYLCR